MKKLEYKLNINDFLEMAEFFEEMIEHHFKEGNLEKVETYKDIRVAMFGEKFLDNGTVNKDGIN